MGNGSAFCKEYTMKTCVTKGRNGWKAVTKLPLSDKQVLTIKTCRRPASFGGQLDTTAEVGSINEYGSLTHVMSLGKRGDFKGDFRTTLCQRALPRATEKTVREQHEKVLANLDEVKASAIRYYAEQARLKAEQACA
jgi:hypothetical protein